MHFSLKNKHLNNCLHTIFQKLHFSKSHFLKDLKKKYERVTILHSKSLKKCHKNFENPLTKKVICKKIFLNRAFSIVILPARKVTIFLGKKSKLVIFHLKCTKPKQNCFVCIAERQILKIIPQICLICSLKVFGLPPLHMQNAYSK